MPHPFIPQSLRDQIAAEAGYRCGYCLTPQSFTAMPMHIEHIIPLVEGGQSTVENLRLACPLCNGYKGIQTHGIDIITHERVPLFNPRTEIWSDHFCWSEDGTEVVGTTSVGRLTVVALRLNNVHLVRARRRWVAAGWHPPLD